MFKPTPIWPVFTLVNFSNEFGQIMTRHDFLEARWVMLSNVLTFGIFSVSRKPIINGGAIRPVGLLLIIIFDKISTWMSNKYTIILWWKYICPKHLVPGALWTEKVDHSWDLEVWSPLGLPPSLCWSWGLGNKLRFIMFLASWNMGYTNLTQILPHVMLVLQCNSENPIITKATFYYWSFISEWYIIYYSISALSWTCKTGL